MSSNRGILAYRSWIGFRLMFQGTDLKLDNSLVPIVKLPKPDSKQKHAAIHNISQFFRRSHEDMFPLFVVSVGLRNRGEIPYPLDQLSDGTIKKMHQCLQEMLDILTNLDKECKELWATTHSFESLFEAMLNGEVSVPAAACYCRKFGIQRIDLGMTDSLRMEQLYRVFDVALKLETEYGFFVKYHKLVENSLRNIDL